MNLFSSFSSWTLYDLTDSRSRHILLSPSIIIYFASSLQIPHVDLTFQRDISPANLRNWHESLKCDLANRRGAISLIICICAANVNVIPRYIESSCGTSIRTIAAAFHGRACFFFRDPRILQRCAAKYGFCCRLRHSSILLTYERKRSSFYLSIPREIPFSNWSVRAKQDARYQRDSYSISIRSIPFTCYYWRRTWNEEK